jgi:cystathionine beta-synthase
MSDAKHDLPNPAIRNSVLDLIGNTPLVRLDRYFRGAPCQVLGKCDFMNPAHSVKDRIGFAMIEDAERAGRIKPGGTLVEATAGNTGLGLCIAAAVKGYKVICVTPDKMSQEKINLMRAFGARVVVVPTVAKDHPEFYTTVAKRIAGDTPNAVYIGQFQNQSNPKAHYDTTAKELWEQTGGKITAFVSSAGTGGTINGVSKFMKEKNPACKMVLADPVGSIYAHWVASKNLDLKTNPYKVEGIGNDYIPAAADFARVDYAYSVSDRESFNAARRLARTEGLFCGGSTGTNLVAAMRYIREHPVTKDDMVVVFLCDTGERYLSKVYNDDWMRENQFLQTGTAKTAGELLFNKEANAPALVTAVPDTPVEQVFAQIKAHDISQVPVIDGGRIVGAVTEGQVLDLLLRGEMIAGLKVRDVMGEPLRVVEPAASAQEMLKVMQEAKQDAVLVRQGASYEILTKFDLLHAL